MYFHLFFLIHMLVPHAHVLHARGFTLHTCCVYVTDMLHRCCLHVAHMLRTCCSHVACTLQMCCTHVTYILHACYTCVACMLHACCTHVVHTLPPLDSEGPANWSLSELLPVSASSSLSQPSAESDPFCKPMTSCCWPHHQPHSVTSPLALCCHQMSALPSPWAGPPEV